jgi:phage shock protein A
MSLWSKIFTMFRGTATEVGQAVVDSNAIRILDQEIRDASNALVRSREDLTKLMAQRRLVGDKLGPKQAKIAEYGSYIEQLLTRGDEALAGEVAQKLAALESESAEETRLAAQYDANIETLKQSILKAESTIARMRQQVDSVKATENVQRAQANIGHITDGGRHDVQGCARIGLVRCFFQDRKGGNGAVCVFRHIVVSDCN